MKTPRVSVCIPNYNNRLFIKDAISSVLNQTFSDFELVIVDDFSTDGSQLVIEGFQDERIRFYQNERNIGRVKNINRCLSLASGEYITILPSDDMYTPTSLERRVKVLDSNSKVCLVHSSAKIIDKRGKVLMEHSSHPKDYIRSGEEEFKHLIFRNYILTPTVMLRKKCCDTLGLLDEEFTGCADWEMWLRIALNDYDIAYVAEPLALERMHSANVSNYYLQANLAGMNEYRMIKVLFSNLSQKKKHLCYLEPLVLRGLSRRILALAGVNLAHGHDTLARQNIGLAIAIHDDLTRDWRTYALFLATFFFKKLPTKTKNVIYDLGKRWLHYDYYQS